MHAWLRNTINTELGYNYLTEVNHTVAQSEGNWKHFDSVAPRPAVKGPATDPVASVNGLMRICGECHYAMHLHPVEFLCNRTSDSDVVIGYITEDRPYGYGDYYVHPGTNVVEFINDYSGTGIEDPITDEWFDSSVELDAIERYRDVNPEQFTHALDWWYVTPTTIQTGNYAHYPEGRKGPALDVTNDISIELRNAYVEGNDGFSSRQLLDETLTKKYHERLLNIFLDKNGDIAIGGIRIRKTVDAKIEAKCVNSNCMARMAIDPELATRDEQETFVLAIIRHGNNHAARWFRDRATFYKVHADGCTLDCDPKAAHCTVKPESTKPKPTDAEVVAFLTEHQRYCRDTKCTCESMLADLMPKAESVPA